MKNKILIISCLLLIVFASFSSEKESIKIKKSTMISQPGHVGLTQTTLECGFYRMDFSQQIHPQDIQAWNIHWDRAKWQFILLDCF